MDPLGGSTKTSAALEKAIQITERRHDPKVPLIVVHVTDGHSDNRARAVQMATTLKREWGAHLFSVGVGQGVNKAELHTLASSQENVLLVDSYKALKNVRDKVATKLCKGTNSACVRDLTPEGQVTVGNLWDACVYFVVGYFPIFFQKMSSVGMVAHFPTVQCNYIYNISGETKNVSNKSQSHACRFPGCSRMHPHLQCGFWFGHFRPSRQSTQSQMTSLGRVTIVQRLFLGHITTQRSCSASNVFAPKTFARSEQKAAIACNA